MPFSQRYCAAISTSPASEATIGFSTPFARTSFTSTMRRAKTIGGVTIVCQ